MRALVTGGGGFLGSHLVERLREDGHDVFVARRLDYDLTSMDDAARLFADAEPELVFHLAAEVGGIGANRANPGRYWFANLLMGAHVLEQTRLHETAKLVALGTICEYPKLTPVPFSEDDLWNGYPGGDERAVRDREEGAARRRAGLSRPVRVNVVHLLPVNLYGPGDNFDAATAHVIPDLIRKMHESPERIVLFGDGSPTREFLYVDDAVEGIVAAAERYDGAEPVNLGSGVEIAIRDLVELVAELSGFEGEVVWDESKPNGQPRRRLDVTRAEELFGFRAQTDFREGLERTIAWYRENAPAHVST